MNFRTARSALLLLGAACAGGTPATSSPRPAGGTQPTVTAQPPATFGPAPEAAAIGYPRAGSGSARYAFERRDSVEVTMPSGESQLQMVGSTAYLTLSWTAADSGTRLEARVDSVVPDPVASAPFVQVDSAQRAAWALRQAPTGAVTGVVGQPDAFRADQIRDQLFLLFPILPAAGARAGTEWSDSTTLPARVSAFQGQEQALVRVTAAPRPDGGLTLTSRRERTVAGEGTQFGQAITVRATGSDSLTTELSADARVLEVSGTRVTDLVVELSAIGQTVPAREVSFFRMTLLR